MKQDSKIYKVRTRGPFVNKSVLFHVLSPDYTLTASWPWQPSVCVQTLSTPCPFTQTWNAKARRAWLHCSSSVCFLSLVFHLLSISSRHPFLILFLRSWTLLAVYADISVKGVCKSFFPSLPNVHFPCTQCTCRWLLWSVCDLSAFVDRNVLNAAFCRWWVVSCTVSPKLNIRIGSISFSDLTHDLDSLCPFFKLEFAYTTSLLFTRAARLPTCHPPCPSLVPPALSSTPLVNWMPLTSATHVAQSPTSRTTWVLWDWWQHLHCFEEGALHP